MEEAEVFRLVRLGHFEEALPKLRKEPSLWQTREEGGHSVLHWAALQNQCSFVREALQHVEVDVRASNLQTPLMWAMTRGHLQVGKVLLQASADPFAQDSVGASPLILAVQHAHVGAMLLLIALVAPNEPGATHGPSTLQRLLQVRDMRGCTAVHWAAYKGDMPALQLLDYFDADFTALDDEKMTALHRAAQGQQEEVIGLLLDRGVDPSVLDVHGRSCLDVAEQVAKTGRMARRLRRLLESKPSKDFEMGKILVRRSGAEEAEHFAKRAKRMAPAIFWLCCVSIACFEYLTELQSSAWTLTPNLAVAFELGVPLCLLLFLLAAQKDPGKVPARVKGNSAVEEAMTGMPVELLEEDSGHVVIATFYLDRTLKRVSLKLPEEHRYYRMQDMIAIFRDKEFTNLVPSLAHLSPRCLAVDFCTERDFRLCFQFQDSDVRDNFYSCLKILRMSLDAGEVEEEEN
ncbi:unnamed protein product [Durusdinium trenchii]|uniref:Uncharacterized protein n=1 Tax=Durusdinium trenchii TaxID=1381693 RepID=A0ABP0LKT5_9DINO